MPDDHVHMRLAPRELEVLALTAHGKTRSQISKIMSVSEETVKAYVERARIKLGAVNKTHAATIALTLGLIELHHSEISAVNPKLQAEKLSDAPQTGTAPKHKSQLSTEQRQRYEVTATRISGRYPAVLKLWICSGIMRFSRFEGYLAGFYEWRAISERQTS